MDLTNNVEYRFTTVAHNAVGDSSPSPASDVARPDIHPDQPHAPTLTFGDRSLKVDWAPATSHGSPVRSYTLEISPAPPSGAQKANLTGTHYEWSGLENGVAYQVRIQAYNDAVDPSTWSEYSSNEIPAGPPEQVAKPTTSRLAPVGNRAQIAALWSIPAGNGDPVSSFTVNAIVGGTVVATQTVSGTTTSVPFQLDPSSSDYTFTVVAHNKAGDSLVSPVSDPRRAFVAPGAPTGVTATPGDRALVVSYTPGPANGADAGWISYEYELNGNGAWHNLPADGHLAGLSNGASYTVKLRATTSADGAVYTGNASSASAAAVPFGPIGAPGLSSAGQSGGVRFTITAPATNGRPITSIEFRTRENSGGWTGWSSAGITSGSTNKVVSTSGPGNSISMEIRVTAQDTATPGTASASNSSFPKSSSVSKGAAGGCAGCNYIVVNWAEFTTGTYYGDCMYNWHDGKGDIKIGTSTHIVSATSSSGSQQQSCYVNKPGASVWFRFTSGPGAPFDTSPLTW